MARLFIYQSSIVSKILDFTHLMAVMVTIFSSEHMTGENREFSVFLSTVSLSLVVIAAPG